MVPSFFPPRPRGLCTMRYHFSIYLTTMFSKLLLNSLTHHCQHTHFQDENPTPSLSLLPSSTISKVQLNFRALVSSLGTGDARTILVRAAKQGAGCRQLVTPPSCPFQPQTDTNPDDLKRQREPPSEAAQLTLVLRCTSPHTRWASGRTHCLSQAFTQKHIN